MQDIQGPSGAKLALGDACVSGTSDQSDTELAEQTTRSIRKHILDLQAYESDMEAFARGPGTVKGPRRYLQHGHPTHLFWEYQAVQRSRQQPVASFTTFMRIFHRVFKQHLKFRKRLQHAECTTCCSLKLAMARAITIQDRQTLTQTYMTHIFDQWRDRQVYWTYRTLSVSFFEQSQRLAARTPNNGLKHTVGEQLSNTYTLVCVVCVSVLKVSLVCPQDGGGKHHPQHVDHNLRRHGPSKIQDTKTACRGPELEARRQALQGDAARRVLLGTRCNIGPVCCG